MHLTRCTDSPIFPLTFFSTLSLCFFNQIKTERILLIINIITSTYLLDYKNDLKGDFWLLCMTWSDRGKNKTCQCCALSMWQMIKLTAPAVGHIWTGRLSQQPLLGLSPAPRRLWPRASSWSNTHTRTHSWKTLSFLWKAMILIIRRYAAIFLVFEVLLHCNLFLNMYI